MARSTAKVHETALSEQDDTVAIREFIAINLVLDVHDLHAWVVFETLEVDFIVEVTHVANDSVVFHLSHMLSHNDLLISSAGDIDISSVEDGLESFYLETFHASLEGADGIALGDYDTGTTGLHGGGATFADITKSAYYNLFAGNHNVGGSHETIGERVFAAIDVIKLLLGNRVVDIDCLEEKSALVSHLLESVYAGSGFF